MGCRSARSGVARTELNRRGYDTVVVPGLHLRFLLSSCLERNAEISAATVKVATGLRPIGVLHRYGFFTVVGHG